MTTTSPKAATIPPASGAEIQPSPDLVTLTIDGIEVSVPKGTLIIRAAELIGISIPRFCDHPLLDPVGACRQCLVEIDTGRPSKPFAACTSTVAPGMVVKTQLTSPVADKAQQGIMEFLLINHPLDCPVCDKGGECPLQNQAMSNGRGESRFEGMKRTYPKPIHISTQVLLDRERCVLCARCTRFSQQIAGDPFIELLERGALQQVGIYEKQPFESYFSGNTVQICPVGALTGTAYRFRSRPFDLVSSPMVCEHCASGCSLRTDHRRGKVMRRLAGDDPQVNEEWNCDKGRWAFHYATATDRLTAPLVREPDGTLVPTSWPDALDTAARGLAAARDRGGVGVLAGGRLTLEDAYAYGKFTRVVLATNDVDMRARPHTAEEEAFLGAAVAGQGLGVTYAELEGSRTVLLVGFEPEEESPILFLRLRKSARRGKLAVFTIAPFLSRGTEKLSATLLSATPGRERSLLDVLRSQPDPHSTDALPSAGRALRSGGAVILVGERAATAPGLLDAVSALAGATGARVAWVPRRAGERGAVEAGLLPSLLPGGRPVADAAARVDVAATWGVPSLPGGAGRDTAGILAAVTAGRLGGLLVGGVDPGDLPDPAAAVAALDAAGFLVSLELRAGPVTHRADVVFPVAPVVEKPGTFLDWEGRHRPFDAVLAGGNAQPDGRVLHTLAAELGVDLGLPDVAAARREIAELGAWEGGRAPATSTTGVAAANVPVAAPPSGGAVLSTWSLLLDGGRMQDGEPYLAGTAHPAAARISAATAREVGVQEGELLSVSTERGTITLPVNVTPMLDRVVWLPTNSPGSAVRATLGADGGTLVTLAPGGAA